MARNPDLQFIRACSLGRLEEIRELLASGISPEIRDSYGLTGLIWAGRKGQVEAAKILLHCGADADATDRRRRTALHHAVAYKQGEFVRFMAENRASLAVVDMHGCTPLDLATLAADEKTVALLESLQAPRAKTKDQPRARDAHANSFGLPAFMGGPHTPDFVQRDQLELRRLLGTWKGQYCAEIKTFIFFLIVDGAAIVPAQREALDGPQPARRSKDSVQVKIYVPEDWWNPSRHRRKLADAVDAGLRSMVALLQRNKHAIDAERLLSDWARIKESFLQNSSRN